MKKKSFLILLLVVCVGVFMPKNTFALKEFNNINVDYRFTIANDDGQQHFILKDNYGIINLESKYDVGDGYYYFEKYSIEDNLGSYYERYFPRLSYYLDNRFWIYYNQPVAFYSFPDEAGYAGGCGLYWGNTHCTTYTTIPLIFENKETHQRKIIFGTYHISFLNDNGVNSSIYNNSIYSNLSIGNTDSVYDFPSAESNIFYYYNSSYGTYILEFGSINFMRNAIYDYSDELWEELNSGPIASSEMQYDNSDNDLSSPKVITFKTNGDKVIYSKYHSNVNYRFKAKNGNGMKFSLHDVSNTFNFSSTYDKDNDAYLIVDNSSDTDYQDGIKEFSKIIIDEVKNGNFSGLSDKYNSITSDNCSSTSCDITTYIPLILEGENNGEMAKQIVLGLMNIQYREDSGNDYYDVSLNVYNNTCDLLNSNIDLDMNKLINLSRTIEEDYSSELMDKYSNGSISLEDISKSEDINSLKEKYCEDVPVINLRKVSNPKTWNSGVIVLIISMIIVIGSSVLIINKKSVKE